MRAVCLRDKEGIMTFTIGGRRYRIREDRALTYRALGYIAGTVIGTALIYTIMLFVAALAA